MRKTTIPMRSAPAAALLLAAGILLGGCGQQGPLYIPDTPAAAQRATLPQTIFGGARAAGTEGGATPRPDEHHRSGENDERPLPDAEDDSNP